MGRCKQKRKQQHERSQTPADARLPPRVLGRCDGARATRVRANAATAAFHVRLPLVVTADPQHTQKQPTREALWDSTKGFLYSSIEMLCGSVAEPFFDEMGSIPPRAGNRRSHLSSRTIRLAGNSGSAGLPAPHSVNRLLDLSRDLPRHKVQVLALISAVLTGCFGYFFTGSVSVIADGSIPLGSNSQAARQ